MKDCHLPAFAVGFVNDLNCIPYIVSDVKNTGNKSRKMWIL
jgi:hypothetical protein